MRRKKIIVGFLILILGSVVSAQSTKKLYQDRIYEPVVLRGEVLASFYNAPISEIFMFAFHDNTKSWAMIPFQFDEMEYGEDPFSPGAFQDFYFLPDDGLLDLRDELVFMLRDLGDQAPSSSWIDNDESKNYPRLEITVTDPENPNNRAYGYLFRSSTINDPVPSPYGFQFDPDQMLVSNNYYSVRLSKKNGLIEDIIIKPPFGSGVDIFDTQKLRLVGVFDLGIFTIAIGKNGSQAANERENLYVYQETDEERYHLWFTPKPVVRLIREVRQTVQFKPLIMHETAFYVKTKFYPFSGTIAGGADLDPETLKKEFNTNEDIYVRMDLLRQSWDFNAAASGMRFFNRYNQNVLIDGVPDQVDRTAITPIKEWTLTTGDQGSLFTYAEFKDTTWRDVQVYYHDSQSGGQADETYIEGGDTGDGISYGDQGILFRSNASDTVSLKLNFAAFFLPKNLTKADGEKLANALDHPLQVASQPQWYTQLPINRKKSDIPKRYALFQNYPNPFNSATILSFALPAPQNVILLIYDNNGRQVVELVNGFFRPGTYQVRWDGNDEHHRPVASGVYFYQIQAGEFCSVKKLILLR
ncbi:MAG: T9SS type A sorting domain-containing protein [candidate division KSB1 bacterium]|nr:T9SS type A sorting domain-containing protein [candidate division KSB1 bacterium]